MIRDRADTRDRVARRTAAAAPPLSFDRRRRAPLSAHEWTHGPWRAGAAPPLLLSSLLVARSSMCGDPTASKQNLHAPHLPPSLVDHRYYYYVRVTRFALRLKYAWSGIGWSRVEYETEIKSGVRDPARGLGARSECADLPLRRPLTLVRALYAQALLRAAGCIALPHHPGLQYDYSLSSRART